KLNALEKKEGIQIHPATSVRVDDPVFRSHAPQLLITHSYSTSDERGCPAAARDVWELLKDLGGLATVTINPAVRCVELAEILEDLGHVLAWIHIGHGDNENGLQQSGDGLFKSADDWLSSFAGYRSSLALALFSSCRSAMVAERFAQ